MCEHDAHIEKAPDLIVLVDALATACAHVNVYPATHPRVAEPIRELERSVEAVLNETGDVALELAFCDDFLVIDGEPLLGASLSVGRLARRLRDIGSGGLRFARSVDVRELTVLVALLGRRSRLLLADATAILARESVQAIEILGPFRASGRRDSELSQIEVPMAVYQSVFGQLEEFTLGLTRENNVSVDAVKTDVEQMLRLLVEDPIAALSIARYEQFDAFTFGHSVRAAILALNFGGFLGLEEHETLRLGTAALLHDVGKAGIPYELLHARSGLSKEQREEIEQHAEIGAKMMLELRNPDPWVVVSAFAHHRRPDGGGYPASLGASVPGALVQMVKLCDVYEALTANRPYKTAMTPMQAYRTMLTMRDHFEPGLLKAFIHAQGLYPLGTEVMLATGETATVIAQSQHLSLPKVQLVRDVEGHTLVEADRRVLNLIDDGLAITAGSHERALQTA